jgi:hypothetical protein
MKNFRLQEISRWDEGKVFRSQVEGFERTLENLCEELRGIGEYLLLMGKENGKYRNGKRRAAEGGWGQYKYLI